jgi:hypothetical protein
MLLNATVRPSAARAPLAARRQAPRAGSAAGMGGGVVVSHSNSNSNKNKPVATKANGIASLGGAAAAATVVGNARRCVTGVVRAGEEGASKTSSDTLSSLSNILGEDAEADKKKREEEERIEAEVMATKKEAAARLLEATASSGSSQQPKIQNRAATSYDEDDIGEVNAAQRGLAAVGYLLPLLDGLKYSKFLLMQFPLFGLALLPLKPAIDLWYGLGFLQIIVFFGLYLGKGAVYKLNSVKLKSVAP